ncbi:MAG: DUF3501 family protein [Rhodospirillales bacterium]|nr:DUF3501 family protein [Rhodospirillales bacterium]
MKTEITRDDLMPMAEYTAVRIERRKRISEIKKHRRVHVGPDATFYFECYETMWHQIQEMLYIEGGGDEQVADELTAYNPLVPNGSELVATLMFEIDDPDRRAAFLAGLGGVEETVTINLGGQTVSAVPETDVDRTTADGKASSIQFLHFPFNLEQISLFRQPGTQVTLGIGHAKYGHIAIMSENVQAALSGDFA